MFLISSQIKVSVLLIAMVWSPDGLQTLLLLFYQVSGIRGWR